MRKKGGLTVAVQSEIQRIRTIPPHFHLSLVLLVLTQWRIATVAIPTLEYVVVTLVHLAEAICSSASNAFNFAGAVTNTNG